MKEIKEKIKEILTREYCGGDPKSKRYDEVVADQILELFEQARQKEKESKQLCPKCGRKMIDAIDWYICEPCWHKVIKT